MQALVPSVQGGSQAMDKDTWQVDLKTELDKDSWLRTNRTEVTYRRDLAGMVIGYTYPKRCVPKSYNSVMTPKQQAISAF